jgi:hypothetical protein
VPIVIKEKQKRYLITGGIGTNIYFNKPIVSIGANYLFDSWSIGTEYIYNKEHNIKINLGIRF